MSNSNKVVWSEGLYLRTQHLQQQDRYAEWMMRHTLRATPLQSWGFFNLELDQTAVDAGLIGIAKAEGVFPDGTLFSIPDTTLAVETVAVKSDLDAGLVSLAIPAQRPDAAQIDPAHEDPSGTRYRGEFISARDAIRGGADPSDIEVARLAPRLLLPGEETEGYSVMPIARISGLNADGSVTLDAGFLPPSLRLIAAPRYAQFLKELVTGLDRIATAHGQMVLDGTGSSMENLLILELANSARPKFAHMLAQNNLHPSDLFMELSTLAGRMATFGSSSRRLAELAAYDHTDPQPAFDALIDTIKSMILTLSHVEPSSRALDVKRHSDNVWTVRLDNPQIIQKSRIVIRVGGDMSEEMLRKIFVDQATVGSAKSFDDLWTSKLPGIPLKPLHSQPREIPYDGDRLCLELDRSSEHWAELADAPGFVMGVAGKFEREPDIDAYVVDR